MSLLKNNKDTKEWAKAYANQTMAYGAFDLVRNSANDLHNLLAVLDGKKDILKKLKNTREAEVLRQRSPFPTLFTKRYLRKLTDDYSFLYRLERELSIHNSRYRQLRRHIADWSRQRSADKKKILKDMTVILSNLMPNSDIHRKIKTITA